MIESIKPLIGENGEKAIRAGSSDITLVEGVVNNFKNVRVKEHLPSITKEYLSQADNDFSRLINETNNPTERMNAFTTLRTMLLSASARTLVATSFSSSMKKNGHDVSSVAFLSGKPVQIGDQTFYNDSILLPKNQAVSLLNNFRSCLSQIFTNKSGAPTPDSAKHINKLMKPLEQSLTKFGPASSLSTGVLEFVTASKITSEFQRYAIAQGLQPDPAKTNKMDFKNSPGLR